MVGFVCRGAENPLLIMTHCRQAAPAISQANKTFYCYRMTAPDPIRPICPICQTPLARERQTRTMQPDNPDDVTDKEFDVWVCPKDRSHEPELHITDV